MGYAHCSLHLGREGLQKPEWSSVSRKVAATHPKAETYVLFRQVTTKSLHIAVINDQVGCFPWSNRIADRVSVHRNTWLHVLEQRRRRQLWPHNVCLRFRN